MIPRYNGSVWFSREDVDWVYVKINRVGSTWMADYLSANDFIQTDLSSLANHHKLIVLREPLEKLMSGIIFHDSLFKKLIKTPKKVLDDFSEEPHVRLQIKSLKNVDLNNCTFIKYSREWTKNFDMFLKGRGTKMDVKPPSVWTNKTTPFENINLHNKTIDEVTRDRFYLKKYFDENPKFNKIIMDYLEEDYKLYNKVEWYGTN